MGILKVQDYESVYPNIRNAVALDYGELVVQQMMEDSDIMQQSSEVVAYESAELMRRYEQEHVDVAILWPDETVTIQNMLNNVYDIFWRLDGYVACPIFAIGIKVSPRRNEFWQGERGHYTFTIDLNDKNGKHRAWNDPKSFFLKFADKGVSFDPEQETNQP